MEVNFDPIRILDQLKAKFELSISELFWIRFEIRPSFPSTHPLPPLSISRKKNGTEGRKMYAYLSRSLSNTHTHTHTHTHTYERTHTQSLNFTLLHKQTHTLTFHNKNKMNGKF